MRHLANGPVAWAFGFIVLSLTFALMHAARVPQPIAYAAVPLVAASAALVGRRRPGADRTPLPWLWIGLVAAFGVCVAIATVWRSMY